MDIQKTIEIMQNEAECVKRNDGKNCDRDCGKCDLLKDAKEILEAYQIAILGFQELQQYRQIGTVDECREARGKMIYKKPIVYKRTNRADCPICKSTVRGIKNPFGDYCSKCGQALKWGA